MTELHCAVQSSTYIAEHLFSETAGGKMKSCFCKWYACFGNLHLPNPIAIFTWDIAMLLPQNSTRHYTTLWPPCNSTNKHTCSYFSASACVKIRIQDRYSFSFKLHLAIISIGLFHMLCILKFSTCSLPLRMMRKPFRAILQNISKKKQKCLYLNMLSEVLHSAN